MPEEEVERRNIVERAFERARQLLVKPVEHVRETYVVPNQTKYPWYHQRFRRVPTIDECDTDDMVCYHEANTQYKRDRSVDSEILIILRHRFEDCVMYNRPDHLTECKEVLDTYKEAEENYFIKYGDLGGYHNVRSCYMKQKHRMMWERRHGKVGTGMTEEIEEENEDEVVESTDKSEKVKK